MAQGISVFKTFRSKKISFKTTHFCIAGVFVLLSLIGLNSWAKGAIAKTSAGIVESVPGELIVKLRNPTSSVQMLRTAFEGSLAQQIESVQPFQTDSSLMKVRLKSGFSVATAIESLKASDQVEYSEPNYIYRTLDAGVPDDAKFGELWGILNTGQKDSKGQVGKPGIDLNLVPVWASGVTGSKDVLVAVIDTGIQWDHPDLQDNLYTNPGESGALANNGIDDDKNGFVDDVHGWNFAAKTASSSDDQGHGSHCAGTIGGSGNNGIGVAGVNWNVTLMPVKFLDAQGGGTLQGAVESINYARKMGAKIMSNSWGGGGASQALKDAIIEARDAGILFVAAAGNDGNNNDSRPVYPAAYPVDNVLAVSAIDNQGGLADFSNYGKKTVHIAAPGVNVVSSTKGSAYRSLSGTSMACPHVSGVAALLLSINPSMSYSDLKERIIKTSQPLVSVRRKVASGGMVSAYNAVNNIVPPSDEPDASKWEDVSFTVESAHPYIEKSNETFVVDQPGVQYIRVFFDRIETEPRYDVVSVENAAGEVMDSLSGKQSGVFSEAVKGSRAVIRLKSDDSVNGWGFKVSKIQVVR
ncbi:MAG: S8 family serine peptidase [Bdellovibrionales bacterium]|nr:S8 family serine peptidase [Bdellovibrionales bacterium]